MTCSLLSLCTTVFMINEWNKFASISRFKLTEVCGATAKLIIVKPLQHSCKTHAHATPTLQGCLNVLCDTTSRTKHTDTKKLVSYNTNTLRVQKKVKKATLIIGKKIRSNKKNLADRKVIVYLCRNL